ncbi:sensor histidine kinase domain protein [Heliomicrobium modesticaldum Ice1]|uniref:histidine kinase n=1 Tax=Heliobacterium modesticaldum (strain ATCC 51547 / Ice1) TaxID=498761 RepID=B0TI95_HELMI|nr:ATP-binding protein [Heliomicrobium modesticaldum]ABZ83515.1 sensor histidine kinase domain protein [Heliomicrobium modesticaldum Ice1]
MHTQARFHVPCQTGWRKLLPLSITKRFYLAMVLLVLLHTFLLSGIVHMGFLKKERFERSNDLVAAAVELEKGASAGRWPEASDDISRMYPGLTVGYYSRAQGQFLALRRQEQYRIRVLDYIFSLRSTGISSFSEQEQAELASSLTLLNGTERSEPAFMGWWNSPVLGLVQPIAGEQSLYCVAFVRLTDFHLPVLLRTAEVIVVETILAGILIACAWQIFTRFRAEIEGFGMAAMVDDDQVPPNVLPELNPLVDKVRANSRHIRRVKRNLAREVTKRMQAVNALTTSEARFTKAFHANPHPMCITSMEDGRFIEVNESFLQATGYERDEVIGQQLPELGLIKEERGGAVPGGFPASASPLGAPAVTGAPVQGAFRNIERKITAKRGEARIWLVSAEVIQLEGRACHLYSVNDITEIRKLEGEFARLDRLNLVAQMAAGIGHEIRNPMTTVRGFLQILRAKDELANHWEHFDLMIEELDRANAIISEFLSLAKHKVDDLRLQNLNAIIRALYPLLEADASLGKKAIRLELGPIPETYLGEKEIRQLVLNLVRNGLEAMGEGGELIIRSYREGDAVVLAVCDQGSGISPDALAQLGTPFFTTKEQGTGLGLAVCQNIVVRHRARMTVETGEQGTTFFVHFPCSVDFSQASLSTANNFHYTGF